MKKSTLILTIALALPASLSLAQRPGGPGGPPPPPPGMPPGPPPQQQQGNQRQPRDGDQRQPLPPGPAPLEHVLDTDDDGIISASEIEHSPDSLAKLDKNKDGSISREELLPPQPRDGANPAGDRPRTRNTTSDKNLPPAPFPGQRPPRDGDAPKVGPRDGDAPKTATGTGDAPKAGAREGDNQNRPKQPPLLHALDANHDGVISAAEIADAPNALLTLDKNNDGQLGPREYMGRPDQPQPPKDGDPAVK